MTERKHIAIVASLMLMIAAGFVGAVKAQAPQQEQLLNGLRVLMWPNAQGDRVNARLRIHAGSAFDPQGKEGTMKLAGEVIFPNQAARDYFVEDLGGHIEIVSNYDYVQINVSARPGELVPMLETLAAALTTPTIDNETTAAAKTFQSRQVAEAEADMAIYADRAARERFFGTFPYGRPQIGTTATLEAIDFADLRFAYDRFFKADNATLALSGNFQSDAAYRAVRRFFGNWLKSDRQIPATFRQPDAPSTALEILNATSGSGAAEIRHVIRGVARSDADFRAVEVLTAVLDARLKQRASVDPGADAFVRNEANLLPGAIVFGVSNLNPDMKPKIYGGSVESIDAVKLVGSLMSLPVTSAEFQTARNAASSAGESSVEDLWLDSHTYKLTADANAKAAYQKLTLADVERVRQRLAKQPAVSVWIVRGVGESN